MDMLSIVEYFLFFDSGLNANVFVHGDCRRGPKTRPKPVQPDLTVLRCAYKRLSPYHCEIRIVRGLQFYILTVKAISSSRSAPVPAY